MDYLEIEKEMKKTYDAIAKKYELEAKENWKDKKYIDTFLKLLPNNKVLDIGCGTGELLKYYNDNHFISYGIDISERMLSIAREKVPNAYVINKSVYALDEIKEKFDGISATFVFVHIPKNKIKEVIKKISDQLVNGGLFFALFTTDLKEGMQAEPLDNNYNYYAVNYSNKEIVKLLTDFQFELIENILVERKERSSYGIVIARKMGKV